MVAHLRAERPGQRAEEHVCAAVGGEPDVVRAHLRAGGVVDDGPAEGAGDKLVAPAAPEERQRALGAVLAEVDKARRPVERLGDRVGAGAADKHGVHVV